MATLYLVPTPLGDPDDITLRALRILREVRAIAMINDDQVITNLLEFHRIETQIIPSTNIFDTLNSGDVALVSDTGNPGMDGAGQVIIREAIARGIRVEPLPGSNNAITALVLSGLSTEAFVYVGDLPDDLSRYTHERDTMIFAVGEVKAALRRLMDGLEDRKVSVSAGLSQPNEIAYRGMMSDADACFQEQAVSGAALIVVEGASEEVAEVWDEARVRMALRERLSEGEPLKLAAKAIAEMAGWDRRAVYALGVDEKRNTP